MEIELDDGIFRNLGGLLYHRLQSELTGNSGREQKAVDLTSLPVEQQKAVLDGVHDVVSARLSDPWCREEIPLSLLGALHNAGAQLEPETFLQILPLPHQQVSHGNSPFDEVVSFGYLFLFCGTPVFQYRLCLCSSV